VNECFLSNFLPAIKTSETSSNFNIVFHFSDSGKLQSSYIIKLSQLLSFMIYKVLLSFLWLYEYQEWWIRIYKSLENQFIYPSPKGSKLIFFAPLGVGVNEEPERSGARRSQNQWVFMCYYRYLYMIKTILICANTFLSSILKDNFLENEQENQSKVNVYFYI